MMQYMFKEQNKCFLMNVRGDLFPPFSSLIFLTYPLLSSVLVRERALKHASNLLALARSSTGMASI